MSVVWLLFCSCIRFTVRGNIFPSPFCFAVSLVLCVWLPACLPMGQYHHQHPQWVQEQRLLHDAHRLRNKNNNKKKTRKEAGTRRTCVGRKMCYVLRNGMLQKQPSGGLFLGKRSKFCSWHFVLETESIGLLLFGNDLAGWITYLLSI